MRKPLMTASAGAVTGLTAAMLMLVTPAFASDQLTITSGGRRPAGPAQGRFRAVLEGDRDQDHRRRVRLQCRQDPRHGRV